MMSSAQREYAGEDEVEAEAGFQLTTPAAELKQEVAARLAAHRRRRGAEVGSREADAAAREPVTRRQNTVAAAIAERYARTPSYRAFLAEQAERAVQEAAAKVEVARRNAKAAAAVQQELLGELELWNAPPEAPAIPLELRETDETAPRTAPLGAAEAQVAGGLTVRLYEDLGMAPKGGVHRGRAQAVPDAQESQALDAEIAFRKAPVFEVPLVAWDLAGDPPEPLPANLLEFPRQLVAARKARPRLAEGPLREEAPRRSQLRIFEVEPEQISTAAVAVAAPEWSTSIRLDAHVPGPAVPSEAAPLIPSLLPPQTAPLALRTMAGLVDAGLVLGGLLAFIGVFAEMSGRVPAGLPAAIALAGVTAMLLLMYQFLFFWFSEQTPGMRYAKIGLCTLSDENPTRAAMRKRILAQAVAVCPLGLGLLWTLVDDDGLGWHDRLSRMYQRAY